MLMLFCGLTTAFAIDYNAFYRRWGKTDMKTLNDKGFSCIQREKMDSALAFLSIVTGRYDESLDKEAKRNCVIAYNNAGYIYLFDRQNAVQAYPLLAKGLDICDAADIEDLKSALYDNLAKIYYDYNDTRKAVETMRMAYRLATRHDNHYIVLMTFSDMVTMAVNSGQLDSIAPEMRHFMAYKMPETAMLDYSKALCAAMIDMQDKHYLRAAEGLKKARRLINSLVDRNRYTANHDIFTAIALEKCGRTDEASALMKRVEALTRHNGYYDILVNVYSILQRYSSMSGDNRAADSYELAGLKLRDSLFNASRYGNIKDIPAESTFTDILRRLIIRQITPD